MWKNYFFTSDFTAARPFLETLEQDKQLTDTEQETLCLILKEHDTRPKNKDKWCFGPQEEKFNITGAKVIYNGVNDKRWKTNAKYANVLVIELPLYDNSPDDRTIYLQYN